MVESLGDVVVEVGFLFRRDGCVIVIGKLLKLQVEKMEVSKLVDIGGKERRVVG